LKDIEYTMAQSKSLLDLVHGSMPLA